MENTSVDVSYAVSTASLVSSNATYVAGTSDFNQDISSTRNVLDKTWIEDMDAVATSDMPRLVVTMLMMSAVDNVTSNTTGHEITLEEALGPQHFGYTLIIPFVVVIFSLSVVGLLGNLFTIIVIVRNRNMRTTTNYYLLSLAVSDLLVIVLTSPIEIASIFQIYPWIFGDFLCWTRYYFIEACTYSTVLNITTFTVERYIAICHPIKAKTMIKKSRVIKIISLICLIAKVLSRSEIKDGQRNSSFKRRNGRIKSSFRIDTAVKTRKQVVKMLGIIALCFALCWFPFHVIRLLPNLDMESWPQYFRRIYAKYLYHVSLVLFYLSSAINPILYNLMSRRFRQAFKKTLCPRLSEKPNELTNGHSLASRTTSL
ncbi:growth hormone secretagogue receptor type 1-like [Glandiceps talaboti]